MLSYKIVKPLSQKGVSQLIVRLGKIQQNIPTLEEEFKKRSLDFIERRATAYIKSSTGGSWYELTHTLESSWQKDYSIGKLINYCWYSALVEFGTGMVGKGTHPDPQDYEYDMNEHEEWGWFFIDDQGKVHFTRGMRAHRFMYRALQDYVTKGEYKKIYEKSFKHVMGGLLK